MTDEGVLQKQKAAQTLAVAKYSKLLTKEFQLVLNWTLVLDKGNIEIIFTAMKINSEFQNMYR